MNFRGKIHKYGDNINTDVIIPARYLNTSLAKELAKHCMEDIDPNFSSKVEFGDIIVAGKNFGCGSSREHAPIAIKALGVSCVIAKSFSRIFYRNSINIGLPIIECEELFSDSKQGDILEVDITNGIIKNINSGFEYSITPFPQFINKIILNDGLLNLHKNFGFKP